MKIDWEKRRKRQDQNWKELERIDGAFGGVNAYADLLQMFSISVAAHVPCPVFKEVVDFTLKTYARRRINTAFRVMAMSFEMDCRRLRACRRASNAESMA